MATKKLHVTTSGDVRPCNARKRPCRYGEERHFQDRQQALKAAETLAQGEETLTATLSKRPSPPAAVASRKPTPRATSLNLAEVEQALRDLGPVAREDKQRSFLKAALDDALTYGEAGYEVDCFVTRDGQGRVTGAATLVRYEGEDELFEDNPSYKLLTYMGSTGGNGRALVQACRDQSALDGVPLYLEPTTDSLPFWQHMGATHDPHALGVFYHGFPEEA